MPIVLPPYQTGIGGGVSDVALFGTGLSQPGGVESFYEYNGLILNNRSLIDTYLITTIDGLADADVRDARQNNPNYHGETPFVSLYGGRTIALTGRIRAYEIRKLRDMQQALKLSFNSLVEKPLRISSNFTDQDVEIYCRKSQGIAMTEAQTNFRFERDFLITLRASDPRFRSVSPVIANQPKSGSTFLPLQMANVGTHRAQPYISILGPITDATITNFTNNEVIQLDGAIPAGEIVNIDTLNRTITRSDGVNRFNLLDVSSDWLELLPDENTLEVTGTGMTVATQVSYVFKHTWL